jgi:hypothetical protein
MAIATYDDANMILRLYELRREDKMRTAREWFARSARFQTWEDLQRVCPPGTTENAYFRQVTSHYEMVASFIANGVLHHELFFQSGRELLLVWVRIEKLIPEIRERYQDPTQFRNLEHVAGMFIEYLERQGPDVYESFRKRIG